MLHWTGTCNRLFKLTLFQFYRLRIDLSELLFAVERLVFGTVDGRVHFQERLVNHDLRVSVVASERWPLEVCQAERRLTRCEAVKSLVVRGRIRVKKQVFLRFLVNVR